MKRMVWKRREEKRLDAELRYHVEARVAELIAKGASESDARRKAQMEFGGLEQIKEDCRTARRGSFVETVIQDVRYGARTLRKAPGFALIVIATLALVIGASTTVFSLVNAILVKTLPYPQSDRIVLPWLTTPVGLNIGSDVIPWSEGQFRMVTREQKSFEWLAALQPASFNLTGAGEPEMVDGIRTSADLFPTLGVSAAIGRVFTQEEDQPGRANEVLLSDGLWRQRFGGDPAVVGRAVELNGASYTVVGVMPRGFVFPRAEEMPPMLNFPRETRLWVPAAIPQQPIPGPAEMAVMGRLAPGVSITQAQAEMDVIARHAEARNPNLKGWFNTRMTPLAKQLVGDTRRPLLLILCAVCVVLLIACSNVANLLLARSLARGKEFTLRTALGAGRGRLVRQILTEGLLLAGVGGAAGILLALEGVALVKRFGPSDIPRLREATVDFRVLLFAVGVTLLSGLLFGLAPALGATRENLVESLKQRRQGSSGGAATPRLRNALLVGEVALALVLVVSGGLLLRTFWRVLAIDGGFNAEHVLTFQLSLPSGKYSGQNQIVAMYQNLLGRVRAIPGVEAAGVGETVPMSGEGESTVVRLSDDPRSETKELPYARYTMVSPGYLSAVGTRLLRGRDFTELDTANSQPVALISASLAKQYWPGQDALGKQIAPGSTQFPIETIVGIVADARHTSLREEIVPEMYVPYNQKIWPSMLNMRVALRTTGDATMATAGVREALNAVDPDLPMARVATLSMLVDDSMTQPRFSMLTLGAFGVLALVLASIGIYGVISYLVSQRTQEIGIRLALGASGRDVFGMVIGQGARLAGLGIAIGLVAALGVTRLMAGYLYGVGPTDPLTFGAVAVLLIGVALLACYVPARRAMRVDPIVSLRDE
jgi:predicted permease